MSDSNLAPALSLLPHGPEFRFIDRLVELDPGQSGVAEYTLRGDEPFLRGHFPGQPILPGVLLIEAAAQLAGVIAQSDPARKPLRELKLTAVRGAKILGSIAPGQTIRLRGRVTARMGALFQATVTADLGEALVFQGDVTMSGVLPE